jgi:hypothetical protein
LPFILPAIAARASPAPIDVATSITVTGRSNLRSDPSGRRTTSTVYSLDQEIEKIIPVNVIQNADLGKIA